MATIFVCGLPFFVTIWGLRIIWISKYEVSNQQYLLGKNARKVGMIFCLSIPLICFAMVVLMVSMLLLGHTVNGNEKQLTVIFLIVIAAMQCLVLYLGDRFGERAYSKESL